MVILKKEQKGVLIAIGTTVVGTAIFYGFKHYGEKLFDHAFSIKRKEINPECWLANTPHETWQTTSMDGLNLQGYYVPKENARYTIVVIHGYHSNAHRMSEYARTFYEAFDCDLFLPDLRGHGASEGDIVGYGWLDKEDIKKWVSLVHEKHPERPIVLFGVSMGGGTVNFLANQIMPGVKVLIEDCGYSTLYEELNYQCKQETHLPILPFYYGVNKKVKKHDGYSIKEADGLKTVSQAKYPMLFIHGLDDEVVPSKMVFDLYNACTSEKQLFFVKDTKHADSLKNERQAYLDTMNDFINEHL